jgi:hypothetical protein
MKMENYENREEMKKKQGKVCSILVEIFFI